ncbi:MAG TPA: BON domain-containing protein [Coxiellaceae bacterium]|nr:BON domain-containing protein [Coxiellaceae bacterium]
MRKTMLASLIVLTTLGCLTACGGAHKNQTVPGAPVYITDQEIASSVQHKIDQTRGIRGQSIVISSQNGVVTLNGSVKSQQAVDLAEAAASSVPGVQAVKSNLVIAH